MSTSSLTDAPRGVQGLPLDESSPADDVAATWHWLQAACGGGPVPPVLAMIGLGTGAVLDALDRHAPSTKILALEPNAALGHALLSRPVCQAWQSSGRLVYLRAPDYAGADQAWRIFPTKFETPILVVHPGLEPGPLVAKAAAVLKQILFGAEANANARRRFAPRYLVNSLRNMPALIAGPSVRALTGAFAGAPAIVVGAGPSLDRCYDDLRAAAGRALIVATDTALRPLLVNGITPHLVVGLDPSAMNARHLLALPECRGTWLVAESALDRRATAAFDGRTFWCAAGDHHPWPWLSGFGAEASILEVWGSVLTGAFQVACLSGCDPVVTVGADLSFPGGRPYARGTTYEFDWAWAAAFGTDVDETWRAFTKRGDIRPHPDLMGADTPTTAVMLSFRDWMVAQAKKGGRRLVNASGAGMLFGDGVEQATLLDVLGGAVSLRPLSTLATRRSRIRPSAIAKEVRALSAHLRHGRLTVPPLGDWADFSGDGFDPVAVAAALDSAALTLETKGGKPAAPFSIPWDFLAGSGASAGVFTALPELTTRVRAALAGTTVLPGEAEMFAVDPAVRADLLMRAFALLRSICEDVARGDDFVSWPDPTLVGDVPAGGICMWPETTRWAVAAFEALLGKAWGRVEPPPARLRFANGQVTPRDTGDGATRGGDRPRPYASHACVLLALEWLRCASSVEAPDAEGLRSAADRLSSLELLMRTLPLPISNGASAELVIEAVGPAGIEALAVPLGVSEAALARVMTGAIQAGDEAAWEIGPATGGLVSTRILVRSRGARRVMRATLPARPESTRPHMRAMALTPRVLTHAGWPAAVVAGQVGNRALCVTPFTRETSLVNADGAIVPYQTWPRPITGALSLGVHGEVAWSNVLGKQPDGPAPYLMYRPAPGADVRTQDLPFRPSAGVWWRGRLYLTCQPTPHAKGGIGSWAPDGDVSFEFPELTLFPIVPLQNGLALEPYVCGAADIVLRRPAPHGWTWMPGEAPAKCELGPFGATSSVASSGEWTAYAHPQADLIRLVSTSGEAVSMRCYYPFRLAWTGDSLVVSTAEREMLIFDHMGDPLDGRR